MAVYDAFVSYSHAKDQAIAAALQAVIQKLGKPWYRRRALRVFRDDTSLSATPGLWPSIERALQQSRFLILLTSPEAAASAWVAKETSYWLDHKSAATLLIGLTDGELAWDNAVSDFRWSDATPLPVALKGRLAVEPKWVDLRAYRAGVTSRNASFVDKGADFAAAIQGVAKEDLLSAELRQQRRALTLASSAAATLLVLAVVATWEWTLAVQQRNRAERALAAATRAANDLVFEVAIKIRHRAGIPVDLVREILTRARNLQRELIEAGEASPALRRSAAAALREMATTLLDQNEIADALEAAEQALRIMIELIAADAGDVELRRELSISHNRVGEALLRANRVAEALGAFERTLAIRQELVARDPGNAELQRDLAVSHERIGDVRLLVQELDEALVAFERALAIRDRLVATTPSNVQFRRDLSVTHEKIGDVQLARGEDERALDHYRQSLDIRESLRTGSTQAERDVAVSYTKIGDVRLKRGQREAAIELYRRALAIRDKLADTDPGNVQWQLDLVVTLVKLAEAGDDPRARLQRALAIARKLQAEGKLTGRQASWVSDLEKWLAELPL